MAYREMGCRIRRWRLSIACARSAARRERARDDCRCHAGHGCARDAVLEFNRGARRGSLDGAGEAGSAAPVGIAGRTGDFRSRAAAGDRDTRYPAGATSERSEGGARSGRVDDPSRPRIGRRADSPRAPQLRDGVLSPEQWWNRSRTRDRTLAVPTIFGRGNRPALAAADDRLELVPGYRDSSTFEGSPANPRLFIGRSRNAGERGEVRHERRQRARASSDASRNSASRVEEDVFARRGGGRGRGARTWRPALVRAGHVMTIELAFQKTWGRAAARSVQRPAFHGRQRVRVTATQVAVAVAGAPGLLTRRMVRRSPHRGSRGSRCGHPQNNPDGAGNVVRGDAC